MRFFYGNFETIYKYQKRFLTLENKLDGYQRGGGQGKHKVEIKESNCHEQKVIYGIVEPLCCTPQTNVTLYVNYWKKK